MPFQRTLVYSVHSIITFFASSAIYFSIINLLLVPIEKGKLQPVVALIIVFCSLFSTVLWLKSGGLSRLDKRTKLLFKWWMFCVLLMLLVGIFRYESVNLTSTQYFIRGLNQDYLYVSYLTLVFIFLDPVREDGLNSLLFNFSKIALIAGLLAVLFADKSSNDIVERSNTWTLQYHLWWLSGCLFSFAYFNSYIKKRYWILGYGVLLVYVIFGILVLKRAAIINLAVIVLITSWIIFNRKPVSLIKRILIFIVFVGGILILYILINNLFNDFLFALFDRFSLITKNPDNIDRLVEGKTYFKDADIISILTGQGLNNYVIIQFFGRELIINALHIGLYDIIYKGGIFYSIFTLIVIMNIFRLGIKGNLPDDALIAVCVGITYISSLFYEMSFSYVPVIFFYLTPILKGFKFLER